MKHGSSIPVCVSQEIFRSKRALKTLIQWYNDVELGQSQDKSTIYMYGFRLHALYLQGSYTQCLGSSLKLLENRLDTKDFKGVEGTIELFDLVLQSSVKCSQVDKQILNYAHEALNYVGSRTHHITVD